MKTKLQYLFSSPIPEPANIPMFAEAACLGMVGWIGVRRNRAARN